MQYFQLNSQFDDYKSVMEMKKQYEEASNSLMYKDDCVFLPDRDSEFGKRFVYQRILLDLSDYLKVKGSVTLRQLKRIAQ